MENDKYKISLKKFKDYFFSVLTYPYTISFVASVIAKSIKTHQAMFQNVFCSRTSTVIFLKVQILTKHKGFIYKSCLLVGLEKANAGKKLTFS